MNVRVASGLAAVDRLEQSSLGVRAEQMSERGDMRCSDPSGGRRRGRCSVFLSARRIRTSLPPSTDLKTPAPERRALAVVRLAGSDVDDVGVRRRDRDVADRRDRILVEDRRPRRAVVGGLPDPASREADVDDRGLLSTTAMSSITPAHVRRTDGTPHEGLRGSDRSSGLIRFGQRRCWLRGTCDRNGLLRDAGGQQAAAPTAHRPTPTSPRQTGAGSEKSSHHADARLDGTDDYLPKFTFGDGLRFRRRGEMRVFLEAEHLRRHVRREAPALRVELLNALVVAHALCREPVLGARRVRPSAD